MNNKQLYDQLANKCSAYVERLFLLAIGLDSGELQDFLEDLEDSEVGKLFPNVDLEEWKEILQERDALSGVLAYNGYFGYLAEIRVPHRDMFRFKEGTDVPRSFAVYPGVMHTEYVYVETLEELTAKLIEVDKAFLEMDIQNFKKLKADES